MYKLGNEYNIDMKTSKMDKVMAQLIIKKGKFEIVDNGKIISYTTYVIVDDESNQVIFTGESKSDNNIIEFRDAIAKVISKYRSKGKTIEFSKIFRS